MKNIIPKIIILGFGTLLAANGIANWYRWNNPNIETLDVNISERTHFNMPYFACERDLSELTKECKLKSNKKLEAKVCNDKSLYPRYKNPNDIGSSYNTTQGRKNYLHKLKIYNDDYYITGCMK